MILTLYDCWNNFENEKKGSHDVKKVNLNNESGIVTMKSLHWENGERLVSSMTTKGCCYCHGLFFAE